MPDDEVRTHPTTDAEDGSHDVGAPEEGEGPDDADAPTDEREPVDGEELEPLAVPLWKLVAGGLAVVVVVVVAVVGAIVLLGDEDDGGSGDGDGEAASASVVDGFDRADAPNELGGTESGQTWEAVSGVWGIEDDQAVLVEPSPEGVRSLAVVDVGASNGTVSATAGTMAKGWGIVFRYQGQFNYWYLTSVPEFATYNLSRVIDGEVQNLGSIGLASVDDGAVVQVRLDGATIEISVDGTPVKAITDTALLGATSAGLMASGVEAADATWESFEATPRGPAVGGGAVTPQTVEPPAGGEATESTPTTAAS